MGGALAAAIRRRFEPDESRPGSSSVPVGSIRETPRRISRGLDFGADLETLLAQSARVRDQFMDVLQYSRGVFPEPEGPILNIGEPAPRRVLPIFVVLIQMSLLDDRMGRVIRV